MRGPIGWWFLAADLFQIADLGGSCAARMAVWIMRGIMHARPVQVSDYARRSTVLWETDFVYARNYARSSRAVFFDYARKHARNYWSYRREQPLVL